MPQADEAESRLELTPSGIDEGLPCPPPSLLEEATFDLRQGEADYLSDAITRSYPGSLLAHLVIHRPATWTSMANAPEAPWDPSIREVLPPRLEHLVDRAQKFSLAIHGAHLLYNLLAAEEAQVTTVESGARADDTLVLHYRELLDEWSEESALAPRMTQADQQAIWDLVLGMNRRLAPATREFLSSWFNTAPGSTDVSRDGNLRDLVRGRELQVKGARARLGNQRALDAWNGASGVGRLTFRWDHARSHLQDIYDGLEEA